MSLHSRPPGRPAQPPRSGVLRLTVRMLLVTVIAAAVAIVVADGDGKINARLQQFAAAYLLVVSPPEESASRPDVYQPVRELTLRKQPDGHFYVDSEVNGRPVPFLVDSGATSIALTRDDAERIGLRPRTLRYTETANTANGQVAIAPVTLRQVRVGQFTVRDVEAVVIDAPGRISLLGMSFLNELEGFEVSGDRLIMRY